MGLVVVDNFDLVSIWFLPSKTNPVLLVHPNAVLAAPVSLESLKPVLRWNRQVIQQSRRVQRQ
jgi:hypothetical protein